MVTKEDVKIKLEEILIDSPIFIVELKNNNNKIIVHLDTKEGIKLKECSGVHRSLNEAFGEAMDNVTLEVSSPGLSSAFKVFEQYSKNIGRDVQIVENDGGQYIGKLLLANEQNLELELKNKEKTIEKIEFSNIKKTTLVF